MSLTVPKAGVLAGRTANLSVETPQAGGVVAQFGAKIAQIGGALEADRLDRQATRLQIDMTRELGQARQEFAQMTNPDMIDQGWPTTVAGIRAQFMDGKDANGRPLVDPKIQDRVGLAFDSLATKHGLALGQVAVAARQSQRDTNWADYSGEVINQSASVDAATRDTMVAQATDVINSDVAAGRIDAMTGVARRIALQDGADSARVVAAVEADTEPFSTYEPDAAAQLQDRLTADADGARLARIMDYAPVDEQAVTDMQAQMDALDALPAGQRQDYIRKQADLAGARRRRALARPMFYPAAEITTDGLREAAQRTVAAFHSGRLDQASYGQQALAIQQLMETFDGR